MENHGIESAISGSLADARLPQNNDDANWDTSDSSTVQPAPQAGFTDVTYALVQYEIAAMIRAVLNHSVPITGRELEYAQFHSELRRRVWEDIESKYLVAMDETDIRQSLTLDIARLTFQRT